MTTSSKRIRLFLLSWLFLLFRGRWSLIKRSLFVLLESFSFVSDGRTDPNSDTDECAYDEDADAGLTDGDGDLQMASLLTPPTPFLFPAGWKYPNLLSNFVREQCLIVVRTAGFDSFDVVVDVDTDANDDGTVVVVETVLVVEVIVDDDDDDDSNNNNNLLILSNNE